MKRSIALMTLLSCFWAATALRGELDAGKQSITSVRRGKRLAVNAFRLPLVFEKNVGQAHERVRFIVRKVDHAAFFLDGEVVFSPGLPFQPKATRAGARPALLSMQFVQARGEGPQIEQEIKARGTFVGKRDGPIRLALAASIVYRDLYPGVDLRFHNAEGRMRYELVVRPEGDTKAIRFRFRGARRVSIGEGGTLVVQTATGALRHSAPVVYATSNRSRRLIRGRFVILSSTDVAFHVTGARPGESIHIDPELSYSTFLGGPGWWFMSSDETRPRVSAYGRIADVYFQTSSSGFPETTDLPEEFEAVLVRFDCTAPQSPTVVFMVIFPSIYPEPMDVASAADGSCYVLGSAPADVPFGVPADALQPTPRSAPYAPFVARVEPTGDVQRMTYLWYTRGPMAIAVETSGTNPGVYLIGSVRYPVSTSPLPPYMQNPVRPLPNANDIREAVVLKLDLPLRQAGYFTFIGGSDYETGVAIAVRGGEANILAYSSSSDYPVTAGAYQSPPDPRNEPKTFFTRLDGAGVIAVSGFLGYSLRAVDTYAGAEVVAGPYAWTVVSPYQWDAAIKLSANGSSRIFQTPTAPNPVFDVAAEETGGVWVAGIAREEGQATAGAVQASLAGDTDAYVALYSASGTLDYATYLGGERWDQASSVARQAPATYVVGETASGSFPVTSASALQPTLSGVADVFFAILGPAPIQVTVTKTGTPGTINENGHVIYTVQITNLGAAPVSGLSVVDQADSDLALFPPQWQSTGTLPAWSSGAANSYSLTGLSLAAGQTVTFTVEAVGLNQGTFQNCAHVFHGSAEVASSCDATVVNPSMAADLDITVEDDAPVPENVPVHFTVTVTNRGSSPVSNVEVHHFPVPSSTSDPFIFANVVSLDAGAFLDANWSDADGYRWVFTSIEPAQSARLFVTTQPVKRGRRQTKATATVEDSVAGPWEAISTTSTGNVVDADLRVIANAPFPAPNPQFQLVSVDVKRDPPAPGLPSFQLEIEVGVDPNSAPDPLPAVFTTPDGSSPGNVSWAKSSATTWRAIFNVSANFQAGTAVIQLPSSVVITSIRAVARDPAIVDPNGAEDLWLP